MAEKTRSSAPVCQGQKHGRERQDLSDFDADVETYDVGDQPVLGQGEFLKLSGETESMEQTENQHGNPGVGLES